MPRTPVCPRWIAPALLICALVDFTPEASGQSLSRSMPGNLAGPLDNHLDWMTFHEYGWRAMRNGWYDTAQREFTSAIQVARRSTMNEPRILARSYSSLAWAIQKQGRAREAEPLARWALDTRLALFEANAEPVARSLNQVATIYLEQNRFAEAEPLLRRVIAMKSSGQDTINLEKAQSESLLGLSLAAQRRYAEGEAEFSRAVALRITSQGAKHQETGDELNNLAWSQIEQGKLVEGRASMDKALQIITQNRGESDPSVARALDGLARIDMEQKDLGAAEAKFRRVIAIYDQPGLAPDGLIKDALKRYADLLDQMDRRDDAKKVRGRLATPAGATAGRTPTQADGTQFKAPDYPAAPAPTPGPRGRS